MITSRRSLLGGVAAFLAAPAIVRASSLMPVKALLGEGDFFHLINPKYIQSGWGPVQIYEASPSMRFLLENAGRSLAKDIFLTDNAPALSAFSIADIPFVTE